MPSAAPYIDPPPFDDWVPAPQLAFDTLSEYGADEFPFSEDSLVAPRELFGAGSQLASAQAPAALDTRHPLSDTPIFEGSVLLLALGYCLVLYYFRGCVAALIKLLRGKLYVAMMLEEANRSFLVFLRVATALGLLAASIAIVRIGEAWGEASWAAGLPAWTFPLAVPIVAAGLALVMGYRRLLLGIAGQVTLARGFVVKFWHLRGMITALIGLVATPLLLLAALNDGASERAMVALLAGAIVLGAGWLLYKSWRLFLSAGASMLHWFLYLCAVEIFPLSLIVGWVARGGGL